MTLERAVLSILLARHNERNGKPNPITAPQLTVDVNRALCNKCRAFHVSCPKADGGKCTAKTNSREVQRALAELRKGVSIGGAFVKAPIVPGGAAFTLRRMTTNGNTRRTSIRIG